MIVKYMFSLIAVVLLFALAYMGVEAAGLQLLFGVIVPYIALLVFIAGFVYRVMGWARSAVPFKIPTTGGQQKSLPWIKRNGWDNPFSRFEVIMRMILEVVLFRSLFRNTKAKMHKDGPKISYSMELWLWLAALLFHYSFLAVFLRHYRLFVEPVPGFVKTLESIDGLFQIGQPILYISGVLLLLAVIYLFLRRVSVAQVRYVSLPADYFPLFLIAAIAGTGIYMRYFIKVDIPLIKQLTVGLTTFSPVIPEGVGGVFYAHLFLVCILFAYFPFSKLMHAGGIFLSPTRNTTSNTRAERHVNPWNYPVKVHTYEEYEDEFRERMIEAGLPVDKE